MIKAPMIPGIQPQRVRRNTIVKDPHPLSITANGGKKIANNTCKQVIYVSILNLPAKVLQILHICKFMRDFLPNCLDEGDGHKAAGNEFEDRSEKDADETTPSCFEGFFKLFAGDEFTENSANERT